MRRLLFPHLAVWVLVIAIVRIVFAPAEVCPPVTVVEVRRSIAEAAAWFERGLQDDGRFTYGYRRDRDQVSSDYNIVRHAGVVMGLYQLAAAGGDSPLVAADAGLAFILDNLVEHDDWAAFALPGQDLVRIGANALTVAALVHRRAVTDNASYDDVMRRLARFLVAQQRPDGSIFGFWSRATGRPLPDAFARFGTGEAFWALGLMHELFPQEGWDEPAEGLADYLATRRDEAEGYLIPEADHWAAYGLAQLPMGSLSDAEATYARDLAGYLSAEVRWESQIRGSGINLLVRGHPSLGAGVGTLGEGMGALWRLSRADARLADLTEPLAERIECLAGILVERQVDANEAARSLRPELAQGAWFHRGYTQMDDQRHSMSALVAALAVLEFSKARTA